MFSFIRNLLALFGVLIIVGAGTAYAMYGTVEPCRILAKERSDQTIRGVSEAFGGDGESLGSMDEIVENTFMALTSQYSSEECGQELIDGWWAELTTDGIEMR